MGYKVLRTESAERDLDEIISYLVEKLCNPPAAVELLSAIDATYTRLEETPFLYRSASISCCPDAATGRCSSGDIC